MPAIVYTSVVNIVVSSISQIIASYTDIPISGE